ncbi:ATP-binding protein [uncultured Chitinophaga sp.]|uniref:sensor histidine kinase n=1 Tax=uncultured Chitinophaga sp. TaxID=339340 RepID=UPI0025D29923|nr:ATP-binding protein [uncultured Chitinophaga sp.]
MIDNNNRKHPDGTGPTRIAEKELKLREEQLRALVENTPDVITRWDSKLKLVFANAAHEEKTGKRLETVIGKTTVEMGFPDEIALPYMEKLRQVFETARPQEHYNFYEGPHGHVHFHSRMVPELDTEGNVYTVLSIARDVTLTRNVNLEMQELNRQLQVKERINDALVEELNAFTRVIGGQYTTALQKAYTSLEFLISNDGQQLSNEGRASLRRVQSALQRMKLMTQDLVSFSSIEADQDSFSEIDLNQVLEIVKGEMEGKLTHSNVVIDVDPLPVVKGYAMLVSLLFYHLLDNAGKFSREGVAPKITIRYNRLDGYHVVSFNDNGIGFEEASSAQIFGLFNRHTDRQRYKGSGIGLAVCKKIMDLHGGFITTESNPGVGSMFSCWFPF